MTSILTIKSDRSLQGIYFSVFTDTGPATFDWWYHVLSWHQRLHWYWPRRSPKEWPRCVSHYLHRQGTWFPPRKKKQTSMWPLSYVWYGVARTWQNYFAKSLPRNNLCLGCPISVSIPINNFYFRIFRTEANSVHLMLRCCLPPSYAAKFKKLDMKTAHLLDLWCTTPLEDKVKRVFLGCAVSVRLQVCTVLVHQNPTLNWIRVISSPMINSFHMPVAQEELHTLIDPTNCDSMNYKPKRLHSLIYVHFL